MGGYHSQEEKPSDWMSASELLALAKPKVCDLIEFHRGAYCHWGMVADIAGYVYHVTSEGDSKSSGGKTWVRLQRMTDVAGESKVRINNHSRMARIRKLSAKSSTEALESVHNVVDTEIPYSFTSLNCEYYSTLWKYGRGWTDQAMTLFHGEVLGPVLTAFQDDFTEFSKS